MSFTPLFKDTERENEVLFLDCEYDVVQSSDGTTWIRIEALAKDDLEYKNNGALFVINNRAMLLRYEFGSWLPIFPNAEFPIEVFAAMQYITLSICIKCRREYTIPVHHVDKLPPLFSEDMLYTLPQKLRTALLELQADKPVHLPSEGSLPIETETEVCEEVEEVKLFTSAAPSTSKKSLVLKYDILAVNYCPIIEALLKPLNSSLLAILPTDTTSLIAYDVEGHLLLIGVCDLQGTWEAREVNQSQNLRYWYTDDCTEFEFVPSPIYHLKNLSARLKEGTGIDAICALTIPSHMSLSEPESIATWSPVTAITFEDYDAPGIIQSNAYFKSLKKEFRPTQPLDRVLIQTVLSTYEPPA